MQFICHVVDIIAQTTLLTTCSTTCGRTEQRQAHQLIRNPLSFLSDILLQKTRSKCKRSGLEFVRVGALENLQNDRESDPAPRVKPGAFSMFWILFRTQYELEWSLSIDSPFQICYGRLHLNLSDHHPECSLQRAGAVNFPR